MRRVGALVPSVSALVLGTKVPRSCDGSVLRDLGCLTRDRSAVLLCRYVRNFKMLIWTLFAPCLWLLSPQQAGAQGAHDVDGADVAAPAAESSASDGDWSNTWVIDGDPAADAAVADGEVIVITGDAPEVAEPVTYVLGPDDVRVLPGAANDALKALQSLPGVARVPYGLGGLSLRGTSPNDSGVFVDGIPVPILYHFGGLASFFPSSMMADLEMLPGGISAKYGRIQGGIVDITGNPGRRDTWRVAGEFSLTDIAVRADGPSGYGGAVSLGLRRSHLDLVLQPFLSSELESVTLAPRYYDGQFRHDIVLDGRHRITTTVFGADDRVAVGGQGDLEDEFGFVSSFVRAGLGWQMDDDGFVLSAMSWLGSDISELLLDSEDAEADLRMRRRAYPMGMRVAAGYEDKAWEIHSGLDIEGGRATSTTVNTPPPRFDEVLGDDDSDGEPMRTEQIFRTRHLNYALWLEFLFRLWDDRITARPGLRIEHYGLTREIMFDPRLTVAHALPAGAVLTQSIGVYHQPPPTADLDPIFGNPDLASSYSIKASAGLEVPLPLGTSLSVTGFYDQMRDTAVDAVTTATPSYDPLSAESGGVGAVAREFAAGQFGSYDVRDNIGRGNNYGVETFLKSSYGHPEQAGSWLWWIAYTYSRALRSGNPAQFDGERPYVLDQPHVLTALASVQVSASWRVGVRVRYASGNPYTPVLGGYVTIDTQEYQPIGGESLSIRLPAFFQADVRVDKSWRRRWGTIRLFLDVQNVSNRVNPEGVVYSDDFAKFEYLRGLPVFPALGVEYVP